MYRRIQLLSYIVQVGLCCNGGIVEGKKVLRGGVSNATLQRQEDIVRV